MILRECLSDTSLRYFSKADYDTTCEAYFRIPIDCMITAAKLMYMKRHNPGPTTGSENPATPQPKSKDMCIYPEMELTVEVDDLRDPNHPKKLRIAGRADWAMGYAGRAEYGAGSVC